MKHNFSKSLQAILEHEGGFVDHPSDPGGATNRGVTLATYRQHFGESKSVADLKDIAPAELSIIYMTYWEAIRGDDLPAGVDYAAFDAAVNSGSRRSARWLQMAVGATPDGVIGPKTVAAVNKADSTSVIGGMISKRLMFMAQLGTFSTFGRGWTRRIAGVLASATRM